jgi:hypothetical protein
MLSFLISSGVTASVPKSKRKGVKLVTLDTVVYETRLLSAIPRSTCPSFDKTSTS